MLTGSFTSTRICKALDSLVIEPFHSTEALLDSYMIHSPCEHILLSTCHPTISYEEGLRVTVSYNPSNFALSGLGVHINRTHTITIFEDGIIELTNFTDQEIFTNETYTLYSNGVSINEKESYISIELERFGIEIRRLFGNQNRIEITPLSEDGFQVDVCGLCGTVNGQLVYSDRTTEAVSIDGTLIDDFAESWQVSPQEVLLGQQGEECGKYVGYCSIGGCVCYQLTFY